MTTSFARSLARVALIVSLTSSLAACDTLASLDPTGLLEDDASTAPDANSAAASPDLAAIPSAPPTTDDQRDTANSLATAGAQAQYSADALRAGTEASAPPPGAAPTAAQLALADAPPSAAAPAAAAPSTPAAPAPRPAAAPAAPPPIAVNNAPAQSAGAAVPGPMNMAPAAPPIAVNNTPAGPAAAPVRTAALPPLAAASAPVGAEPAVPAVPPSGAIRSTLMAPPVMSDAALGFKPSSAPPLDPSVSNFVSTPLLSRYNHASTAMAGSANAAVPVAGGTQVASAGGMAGLGGTRPTAVIMFPGDGVVLSAAGRAQLRSAVAAFKASGGSSTIRVVGHASSRTPDMPVEKHLELIFEKSHKRALAVLDALVREGVPANHVQVEAVGDSQPVYYESMPKGEEGNRRVEVFVG